MGMKLECIDRISCSKGYSLTSYYVERPEMQKTSIFANVVREQIEFLRTFFGRIAERKQNHD